jgi:nucleoside-diphosphate-sugar epimerase
MKDINKEKITIFGHTGFIGRNLVLKLNKKKSFYLKETV